MKYYRLEPSYKKSVVEIATWKRTDEDGNLILLRKELGWRWGSWLFAIPETDEEKLEFAQYKGDYESIEQMMEDHYGYTEEDGMTLEDVLLPDVGYDEFVDITEDYDHAEMLETWDGCWEDWAVQSHSVEIDEEQADIWCEEAQEVYDEDYEEGVESLGWEFIDTFYEMHCKPVLIECDEYGRDPEDADT